MECPNCHQPVETGAAFCGNCGQPLTAIPAAPGGPPLMAIGAAGLRGTIPSYAVATPAQRGAETKTLITILAGALGLIGALFIPLAGLALGTAGLVIGTTARISGRRWPIRIGLFLSCLAVLAGLGTWAYAIKHDAQAKQASAVQSSAQAVVSASLSTKCYSTNFVNRLNVSNSQGSCNMTAYNGPTIDTSTDAYKIYATQNQILNVDSFTNLAKTALEKDVRTNLPKFSVQSEQVSGFAGSPAYSINAYDQADGVAVVEAAVYHAASTGDNVFILVHITTGDTADLHVLESQWQWK